MFAKALEESQEAVEDPVGKPWTRFWMSRNYIPEAIMPKMEEEFRESLDGMVRSLLNTVKTCLTRMPKPTV